VANKKKNIKTIKNIGDNMKTCHCSLTGTHACKYCNEVPTREQIRRQMELFEKYMGLIIEEDEYNND
jgi:hypothetical protein